MSDTTNLFEKNGGISRAIPKFELRQGQIELSNVIHKSIKEKHHLIAEAGTGIGKTLSYLLPAILENKKIFISTATKHLQDQIFFKDIPIAEVALNKKISSCILKGRSNYFCHYRFYSFERSEFSLIKKYLKNLDTIRSWSDKTLSGDLSEITTLDSSDKVFFRQITSTADNCLGSECDYFSKCFLQKAREKAKKSEVVIVNHSLLMADIILKETGFAEILPDTEVVIIDEAHHLAKVASNAFAKQISSGQLIDFARDCINCADNLKIANDDYSDLVLASNKLIDKTQDFLEVISVSVGGEILLGELKNKKKAYQIFKLIMKSFKSVLDILESYSEIKLLDKIYDRAKVLADRIKEIFISSEDIGNYVSILSWSNNYFSATKIPIYLGNRFKSIVESYGDSWIFVSATLTIDNSFYHCRQNLGLESDSFDINEVQIDSPFDYKNKVALHILDTLPDPRDSNFVVDFIKGVTEIIKSTKGRTFMLFTSYKSLYEAAELLAKTDFKLFIQGDLPKIKLIDGFIKSKNAVLLGTFSFWEGVDIKGEKLSCVIIDKIPFPSPNDPIISEQMKYLEKNGKNSFKECFIPRAAVLLKQGVGRLIRSESDTGVIILGDNRVIKKSYGKYLLNSIPPAKLVNKKELNTFIEVNL